MRSSVSVRFGAKPGKLSQGGGMPESFSMLRLLLLALIAYFAYLLLLFVFQRFIIYPGRSIWTPAPPPPSAEITELWFATGVKTEAWYLSPRGHKGRRPAVLFFHGNGEIIDFLPDQVEAFRRWGLGVMLVEFPGYGRSAGTPTEASITAVALAAYDALIARPDVDPRLVTAFGRSLGCGAACALSRERTVAALILQAPFTSLRDFAPRFLVPRVLIRDVFDNRAALSRYPGPVLILHGTRDDVIPVAHGRELARTAPAAEYLEMDCAHNDCPPDHHEYWDTIRRFMVSHNLGVRN